MRTGFSLLFVILATALAGCSSVSVKVDYNRNIDFAYYQIFAWMPDPAHTDGSPFLDNALFKDRVAAAIDSTLTDKGFRREPEGEPDFLIAYHAALRSRTDVKDWGFGYGHPRTPNTKSNDVEIQSYTQAMLMIDFFDAKTEKLVWRGTAIGKVQDFTITEEQIQATVKKVLMSFPPEYQIR